MLAAVTVPAGPSDKGDKMLVPEDGVLVVVDIQGKLASLMHERERLYDNVRRLVRGCAALELPILWTEQVPEKLGPTVPEVAELLAGEPIAKSSFSGWGEGRFRDALARTGRSQVLLAGIESHICVYQTARDLDLAGFQTYLVADAVSSRTAENRRIGLEAGRAAGARITSVEAGLFEMLGSAEHPAFREIAGIVK